MRIITPIGSRAVRYAERGHFLFPIRYPHKDRPLVKWSLYATNNTATIRRWWSMWPDANIGYDCGRSKTCVLDVDVKDGKDGRPALDRLEFENGQLPPTRMQRTPSGGLQYIFRGILPNTVGVLAPGLDTRGPGGMVLLPPSRTLTGRYEWLNHLPPADVPSWIGELLGNHVHERVEQEPVADLDQPSEIKWYRDWLRTDAPCSIMGNGGGDVLVKFIVPVGKDRGLTRETVKDILCEAGGYNDTKCDPAWDLTDDNDNGLFKKVDNGFDYCRDSKPGSATAQADFAADPVSDAELASFKSWWKAREAAESNGELPTRNERRLMRKKREQRS